MLPTLTNILNGLIPPMPDTTQDPDESAVPAGRPAGDLRLAQDILEDHPEHNPLLETLELKGAMVMRTVVPTSQKREMENLRDQLKLRIGDWTEANQNPHDRADALYKLIQIMNQIDNIDGLRTLITCEQDDKAIERFIRLFSGLLQPETDVGSKAFSSELIAKINGELKYSNSQDKRVQPE